MRGSVGLSVLDLALLPSPMRSLKRKKVIIAQALKAVQVQTNTKFQWIERFIIHYLHNQEPSVVEDISRATAPSQDQDVFIVQLELRLAVARGGTRI